VVVLALDLALSIKNVSKELSPRLMLSSPDGFEMEPFPDELSVRRL